MRKNYTKKQRKITRICQRIGILLFALVMLIGGIGGLAFFARPSSSNLEKRQLTAFPAFSLNSFLDGSYFSAVSTWYADTYPGRDTLMQANQKLSNLKGVVPDVQVVGGQKADAIPDAKKEDKKETYTKRTEVPDSTVIAEELQDQIMAGLLVNNGAAYGGYYFNQEAADYYIDVVNKAADQLKGITNVYSILVPNNSGVMLSEEMQEKLGGSNQEQATDYYYSSYNDNVKSVPIIKTLKKHNDEYLYFRTDHHWTPLGAYYAYVNFCKEKGIEPNKLKSYETYKNDKFLGSYFLELDGENLTPDTITAYIPKSTNDLRVYSTADNNNVLDNGSYYDSVIVNTSDVIDDYNGYMRFIEGDRALEVIDNPDINDGSSCMIVKESYGNVFAPFLADHYDKVYIVDFRYNDMDLVQFCKDNKVNDLILMNNLQLIGNTGVAAMYEDLLE